MPTKEGFDPADPLPRFLVNRAEQDQDTDIVLDEPAPRSGVFKAIILIVSATATGIAVLAAGDPMALPAWVSASLVGNSTPAILSAADPVLPPAASDAAARNESAASEQAAVGQTEARELPSETLKHFQAWAAEREAQTRVAPASPAPDSPAQAAQEAAPQDTPAPAAENVQAPDRLAQKRRQARSIRDARAELRTQNLRRQARRAERARAERPPEQDARAQETRAQGTSAQPAPPLPYWFGLGLGK